MTVPRPWSEAEFVRLLDSPGVFVCGGAQAFALGRVAADEAELLTLATDPDHRRKGLGRSTLTAFEAEAAARGATRVFLEVAQSNTPAIALYTSQGYGQTGARPGYYRAPHGAPVDALILSKSLDAT